MKLRKSHVFTLVLVVIAAFIHIYSNDSTRVENQYSTGIYPAFGRVLRYLFGWLPFSIGDVLYGGVILWLTWSLIKGARAIFKKQVTLQNFLQWIQEKLSAFYLLLIYFSTHFGESIITGPV